MEIIRLILLLLVVSGTCANPSGGEDCTLDVIAVVDGSDSIDDDDFKILKTSVVKLADWLDLDKGSKRFGAVVYSSAISDIAPISSDISKLRSEITAFKHPKQGTSTHLGIIKMTEMFQNNRREDIPQVGIVITDGRSINSSATEEAATEAKNLGITMISVGIGVKVNKTELQGIATSESDVMTIKTFQELESLVTSLVRKFCIKPNPCSNCRFTNGVGYIPHASDCRYFLQCIQYLNSYSVMPCPPGLYWEQTHLTCTKNRDNCTEDIPVQVEVVDEDDEPDWSPSCDGTTRYVPQSENQYEEYIPSHGWVRRYCAPGTVYNHTICTCVHGGSPVQLKCKPEVYLPFTGNVRDESDHKLYIQNDGVKTSDGKATFTKNSFLRINRFSNMDFRSTLIIKFDMKRTNTVSEDQAIVTNAECGLNGSIYIIMRKDGYVEFRVLNKSGKKYVLAVQYSAPGNDLARVSLVIHDGKMIARVNNVKDETMFKGTIEKSHCAIELGKGTYFASFIGLIDEFKIYTCKP